MVQNPLCAIAIDTSGEHRAHGTWTFQALVSMSLVFGPSKEIKAAAGERQIRRPTYQLWRLHQSITWSREEQLRSASKKKGPEFTVSNRKKELLLCQQTLLYPPIFCSSSYFKSAMFDPSPPPPSLFPQKKKQKRKKKNSMGRPKYWPLLFHLSNWNSKSQNQDTCVELSGWVGNNCLPDTDSYLPRE